MALALAATAAAAAVTPWQLKAHGSERRHDHGIRND